MTPPAVIHRLECRRCQTTIDVPHPNPRVKTDPSERPCKVCNQGKLKSVSARVLRPVNPAITPGLPDDIKAELAQGRELAKAQARADRQARRKA